MLSCTRPDSTRLLAGSALAVFLLLVTLPAVGLAQVVKSCGKCGRSVSSSATVGGRCPHCGVVWRSEINRTAPSTSSSTPAPEPSWDPDPAVLKQIKDIEDDVQVRIDNTLRHFLWFLALFAVLGCAAFLGRPLLTLLSRCELACRPVWRKIWTTVSGSAIWQRGQPAAQKLWPLLRRCCARIGVCRRGAMDLGDGPREMSEGEQANVTGPAPVPSHSQSAQPNSPQKSPILHAAESAQTAATRHCSVCGTPVSPQLASLTGGRCVACFGTERR